MSIRAFVLTGLPRVYICYQGVSWQQGLYRQSGRLSTDSAVRLTYTPRCRAFIKLPRRARLRGPEEANVGANAGGCPIRPTTREPITGVPGVDFGPVQGGPAP